MRVYLRVEQLTTEQCQRYFDCQLVISVSEIITLNRATKFQTLFPQLGSWIPRLELFLNANTNTKHRASCAIYARLDAMSGLHYHDIFGTSTARSFDFHKANWLREPTCAFLLPMEHILAADKTIRSAVDVFGV